MRQIQFSKDEVDQLAKERLYHPHHIVRRRMTALHCKAMGHRHKDICKELEISSTCLREYLDLYINEGLEGLRRLKYKGKANLLNENRNIIIAHLETDPPGTLKEAQAKIDQLTGIRRSIPQIREFLKKNKILRRKVKQIPEKANIETQEQFRTETLEPLVKDAQEGKIELLFMDAAHFVMLPFLGYLYSLAVRYVKNHSGRKRFNVLGAINAVTNELIMVTEEAYVNSMSVCALLKEIAIHYYDRNIVIVLDNARYQRCRLVMQTAERLHIQLLFLPPYSPNLNLIERLWKFVKKKVLYNKFHPDFQHFCTAISTCLERTHTEYREELQTLLRPNFQSFKNVTLNP